MSAMPSTPAQTAPPPLVQAAAATHDPDTPLSSHARLGPGADILMAREAEEAELRIWLRERTRGPMLRFVHEVLSGTKCKHVISQERFDVLYEEASRRWEGRGLCVVAGQVERGVGGLEGQRERAMHMYMREIEEHGCMLARMALAELLETREEEGTGLGTNLEGAARLYEEVLGGRGFILAMRKLGLLLERGVGGVRRDVRRAVHLYERAVREGGSTEAMALLAAVLMEGRGDEVPRDRARAVRLYERAIREGKSSEAMNGLALLLEEEGEGVARDCARAKGLYESAIATNQNRCAMHNLACLLWYGGEGVDRDAWGAVALYEEAVKCGNHLAMKSLGMLLQDGGGEVPPNSRRAVELYEMLANHPLFNDVRFNLAFLLSSNRESVPYNPARAIEIYEDILAEENNSAAMFNLACVLSEKRGKEEPNWPRVVSLYEKAITESEHLLSMHNLGSILSAGAPGVGRDIDRAVWLLSTALAKGHKPAIFDLALALASVVDGKPVNMERAVACYEDAIRDMDHIAAMINLSELLCKGEHGLMRDSGKAIQLAERAIAIGLRQNPDELSALGIEPAANVTNDAESMRLREFGISQGWHLMAMCNLAELMLETRVPDNIARGIKLFEVGLRSPLFPRLFEAQEMSFDDAFRAVRAVLLDSTSASRDVRKAVKLYELLIESTEHTRAMRLLALIYVHGDDGIPRDVRKGRELLQLAIQKGDVHAMVTLSELLRDGNIPKEKGDDDVVNLLTRALALAGSDELGKRIKVGRADEDNKMDVSSVVAIVELAEISEQLRKRRPTTPAKIGNLSTSSRRERRLHRFREGLRNECKRLSSIIMISAMKCRLIAS